MRRDLTATAVTLAWLAVSATPAWAHEAPDEGAEWIMADWMMSAFLVFFVAALVVFVVALKRGWMRRPEDAKYHILTIDEPDFYTPDWAREDEEAADAPER